MHSNHSFDNPTDRGPGSEVTDCACAAEEAIRRLARLTVDRPSMTPADVDIVLAHLAEAVAALPQVTAQLGDVLDHAKGRLPADDGLDDRDRGRGHRHRRRAAPPRRRA